MATKVSIANQALSWLGANLISAFTDDSTEAGVVSANYDGVRDAVLEEIAWTFASDRAILTAALLIPPEFGYSHRFKIPSGTLRLLSVRNDPNTGASNLDWVREGNEILCDCTRVYIRYLFSNDDPLSYSAMFVQALAARLAVDMAIPISQSRSLQQDMMRLYQYKLQIAATQDGKQGRAQRTGKRKWHVVRGATGGGSALGPIV